MSQRENNIDKTKIFKKIVEYLEENNLSTVSSLSRNILGSESNRTVMSYILAIMCLYDIINYKKIGRSVIFKIKNKENLQKLINDWEEKVWF